MLSNDRTTKREEVRLTAIKLYLAGLPVLVSYLKVAVSNEIQAILNKLAELLPQCHTVSESLSFFEKYVTEPQFEEFAKIVGETEFYLEQVDLNNLYE